MKPFNARILELVDATVASLLGETFYENTPAGRKIYIIKGGEIVKALYASLTDGASVNFVELKRGDYQEIPAFGSGQWWCVNFKRFHQVYWSDMGNEGAIKVGGFPAFRKEIEGWMSGE